MKREWLAFSIVSNLVALVLVLALTGCGAVTETEHLVAVSGEAVSGEAVVRNVTDDSAVKPDGEAERKDGTVSWYANKDNEYEISDEELLVQKKRDGTVVHTFQIKDLYQLGRVTNQWIYYIVYREDDMDKENCCLSELWRMSTGKRADGDHPDLEKKELLLSLYHMSVDFYVTDDYIIYLGGEDDDEERMTVYRFDLQTKQSVPLMDGKKLKWADLIWRIREDQGPLMLQGQLFLDTEDSIYAFEADSGRYKQIYYFKKDEAYANDIEQSGEYIYFSPDNSQIYRYHAGDEKAELFIPKAVIQQKLEEICLWGKNGRDGTGGIYGIMSYKDRLYLDVSVSWKQKMRLGEDENGDGGGEMTDWDCNRTILLSVPVSSPEELAYESAVTDYFKKHSQYIDNMRPAGNEYLEDSRICGISPEKGEILLMSNGSRYFFDTRSYAAYDLTTKKIRKVKRKEAEKEW